MVTQDFLHPKHHARSWSSTLEDSHPRLLCHVCSRAGHLHRLFHLPDALRVLTSPGFVLQCCKDTEASLDTEPITPNSVPCSIIFKTSQITACKYYKIIVTHPTRTYPIKTCLFCPTLYFQHLEQCLAVSRWSARAC